MDEEKKEFHFFVLVHGLRGVKEDFDLVEESIISIREYNSIIVKKKKILLIITKLKSEVNSDTSLGIEVGGKKLSKEVKQTKKLI